MVGAWLAINNLFLFLCTAMYLGTGWSLVLFSFPIAPKLRPDNYYNQFVPQVTAATKFFTVMTVLMAVSAILMITGGPQGGQRLLGAVVLAASVAAILRRWMARNRIRVGLWTLQWAAVACWFGLEVTR
jgi:hypothetical protein